MQVIELELTYLAKTLPANLASCSFKVIADVYFPAKAVHPTLRVRQNGDHYEITKKLMADETDSSHMIEHTIELDEPEFRELTARGGKRVVKRRYQYEYEGRMAEVDVFEEALVGLVVADFEFTNREDQLTFTIPEFCLVDVTQDALIAGGKLAGKSYDDIRQELEQYGYKPLFLEGAHVA